MITASFIDLLRRGNVAKIEIPIIQRDYAQGRSQEDAARIRAAFLAVLHDALTGGSPRHLDFVYGEIQGERLIPLDGQQRLTALFLLHWYLAARAGVTAEAATKSLPLLTYETRHSSRVFCAKLVAQRPFPLPDKIGLSDWLRDQSWFIGTWNHDPTIVSMLVVLDDIHRLFGGADCTHAWQRLVEPERPAITFDFLPIENLGLTDDLYIKMNSRGKPLTKFENFKAEFEALVRSVSAARYEQLCAKIDNEWSDVLWKVRGLGDLVDDEFMRYFRFVTDSIAESSQLPPQADDLARAAQVYGPESAQGDANLDVLFHAFDDWHGKETGTWFEEHFTRSAHEADKVTLFDETDLFRACCKSYGERAFQLWKVLMLFAVLTHLRQQTAEFSQRARTLRNLALNSPDEVRQQELPGLLVDSGRFIADGRLQDIKGFNQRQRAEEVAKAEFLALRPELAAPLRRLEDHPLLRGCLAAFDLDVDHFEQRAATFAEIFRGDGGVPVPAAKAALLACGDYSQRNRTGKTQFATDSRDVWRDLLTRNGSPDFPKTRAALRVLLDAVGPREEVSVEDRLRAVVDGYLAAKKAEGAFDWRYYLVKYEEMRSGDSGLYAGANGQMGFSMCMLRKTQLNSYYRDPFLFAIYMRSTPAARKAIADPWFSGLATAERWLQLANSGAQIRCVDAGFAVKPPAHPSSAGAFEAATAKHGVGADGILVVPQETREGIVYDQKDRVELGVRLVADLIALQPV